MDISLLKKIGFSDKTAKVYLSLLQLGPSSVRELAQAVGFNRGTTYDALKWLEEEEIVSFYKKELKQHFVAEPPEKLFSLLHRREEELGRVDKELERSIPELEALYHSGEGRPVARYVDKEELHEILEDVLAVCEQTEEKMYRIYSAEGLRPYLYEHFSTFSDVRVSKGVAVQVIAIGKGGELRGLDERKWLPVTDDIQDEPTYIMIYPGKTAYISLNTKKEPVGVVIENQGVYATQKRIFDELWRIL